jgi:hypothetical protein
MPGLERISLAHGYMALAATVEKVVSYPNFACQIGVPRVVEAFAGWLSDAVGVPGAV